MYVCYLSACELLNPSSFCGSGHHRLVITFCLVDVKHGRCHETNRRVTYVKYCLYRWPSDEKNK